MMMTNSNAMEEKQYCTESETRMLAWIYQSNFVGILGDIRAEEYIGIVKATPEYRANHKNCRKYVAMLQRAIKDYEYKQFGSDAPEMRQKYLEIAAPILADEQVMMSTITNNLHHQFAERADLAAAFMQSWLLTKLACLIISDNKITTLANRLRLDGTNVGITAINKLITDIASVFDNVISGEFDTEQVFQALHILDRKFETSEDMLLKIIDANGLKVKFIR
jgi:hypothetical protein